MQAVPYTAFLGSIPEGDAGVKATLRIMVSVVRAAKKTLPVVTLARSIVKNCPPKDYVCEATALQQYVQQRIRYTRDINNLETVQYPEQTLSLGTGDCDDMSILLASLAESVGFPTRFAAIGLSGEGFSHVLAQLMIPGQGWVSAEVIPIDGSNTQAPLGWYPPEGTTFMLYHV
jgi:transglutaminase-like putative cysteine protease